MELKLVHQTKGQLSMLTDFVKNLNFEEYWSLMDILVRKVTALGNKTCYSISRGLKFNFP